MNHQQPMTGAKLVNLSFMPANHSAVCYLAKASSQAVGLIGSSAGREQKLDLQ